MCVRRCSCLPSVPSYLPPYPAQAQLDGGGWGSAAGGANKGLSA